MKKIHSFRNHVGAFWSAFTLTCLGGLAGVWWLSERLQNSVEFFLVNTSDGVPLNGQYKLNISILFVLVLSILVLSMFSVALLRAVLNADGEDVKYRSNLKYDDVIARVSGFVDILVPNNKFTINKYKSLHTIYSDGSTEAKREYEICANAAASLFRFWVRADDESTPIEDYKFLQLVVIDKGSGAELNWIPTKDNSHEKSFVIYFPEMSAGQLKHIEVRYRWPGYLRRVLEKGSTTLYWAHSSVSSEIDTTFEWLYKDGFPQVRMRLEGNHGTEAKLTFSHTGEGVRWTYHNSRNIAGKTCCITVEKVLG